MNEKIGARLEYDAQSERFVGDNRSSEKLDDYIESIRGTDIYSWGDTAENIEQFNNIAGLKVAILRYGMVFIVLFFVFFFLYSRSHLKGNNTEIFLFMLLLFLTLYQRPAFVGPGYLFLFTIVVLTLDKEIRNDCRFLMKTN